MTTAYDNGICELWIVNVGDIFSNEYPLAYFLDLAYDFDRYGTSDLHSAVNYTKDFPKKHFAGLADSYECAKMAELLRGYTKITGARRAEAMNAGVYAPFGFARRFPRRPPSATTSLFICLWRRILICRRCGFSPRRTMLTLRSEAPTL